MIWLYEYITGLERRFELVVLEDPKVDSHLLFDLQLIFSVPR